MYDSGESRKEAASGTALFPRYSLTAVGASYTKVAAEAMLVS